MVKQYKVYLNQTFITSVDTPAKLRLVEIINFMNKNKLKICNKCGNIHDKHLHCDGFLPYTG